MTRLFNDPDAFADESARGFARAFAPWVRRASGGVVRSTRAEQAEVAVVIGGGSGHYPAFAGLVGPGLAHGAVMGNLFASPSAHQVQSIVNAVDQGEGVLLSYGNYAGDVLHFDEAQQRLRAEGHRVETVVVTDDISSALRADRHKRRGIAGDLTVFKTAGAASAQGASLDEVVRLARRANDRTFSFGVAFTGCTLPGASEPLFTVPEGRMAVGMGIHGEPGIDETDVPSADGLAELLVDALLDERPDDVPDAPGARVVVLLNGLGSVKYEELFVLYSAVADRLEAAGVEIVEPEVGELVTSFDMAGVSLTLFWVDDELERLWAAPASTPAFRKGAVPAGRPVEADIAEADEVDVASVAIPPADEASRATAASLARAFAVAEDTVNANVDELGRVDAVAGDGDHGIGMHRGVTAARAAADDAVVRGAGAGTTLRIAADRWSDAAGGTSGALWAAALRAAGAVIGDTGAPDAQTLARAVSAAAVEIQRIGKAELGDKTMVDVLLPYRDALSAGTAVTADSTGVTDASADWAAFTSAALTAESAAAATADLVPRIGRARPHAEKSVGTPDAGALSLSLIIRAVTDALASAGAAPAAPGPAASAPADPAAPAASGPAASAPADSAASAEPSRSA